MSPRNAALLLLLTAVAGQGLIRWRARPGEAPGEVAFRLADTTSLRHHREASAERSPEVGEGEYVDADRAGAGELARLPGVGPGLAKRIVAERARGGPYGGTGCLDARVPGIGDGFLRRAGPHLRFSGGGCVAPGAEGARSPLGERSVGAGCAEPVDLNRATKADLECLPGIGAARAESILAWRDRRGGFRAVGELEEVPGVPERVVRGLTGRVRVGQAP